MIKVGDKYAIGSNTLNVTVYERRVAQKGKLVGQESWNEIGYFGTVHGALQFLIDHKIRATELKDVKTVVDAVEKLYKEIGVFKKESSNEKVNL